MARVSVPEVIGVAVFTGRFSWISLINPDFRPRKHGHNVVAGSDTRALFPQFCRILPIGIPKTGVRFALDDFKRLGTEACYRRARVGNPGISEKPKAHFLGGFGCNRPKDFRPLGDDGDACLVGQCHIADSGCLNACPRVVGKLKDGSERKLGAGAHESPKRHLRAIELGALSKPLFGAIERLIDLLAEPECIPVLSPLVQKEIVFRLLTTECGPKIRQIATGGSHIHQISRVIDWIKGNLSERLRVEDLAGRAGMSVSTLHHHFRSLTALSPLQFEKHLRLNEARRLMLIDRVDAATAAFQVGCESPSQFSREDSGGTRPSGGRGVEKRNGRKVPRVHGQRALRQGVIFRCFLPATQALEN